MKVYFNYGREELMTEQEARKCLKEEILMMIMTYGNLLQIIITMKKLCRTYLKTFLKKLQKN